MRVGVLTGGGDCPGLNAVIRAVVKTATTAGWEVLGIRNGFEGLFPPRDLISMSPVSVRGILPRGGTILGTANRGNPFARRMEVDGHVQVVDASQVCVDSFHGLGLDGLIVIGGDGTLTIAHQLAQVGVPVVGVPKTIDNDLSATDRTFGFDTAMATATDAIDKLHTTAESHHRVMVLEVMGRDAGWIALHSGIAGGADVILIPEIPFHIDYIVDKIRERDSMGSYFSLVVVAEGAMAIGGEQRYITQRDAFGPGRLGGVGTWVTEQLAALSGHEVRCTVLGHVQRGGTPTPYDRVLATRYGAAAARLVVQGKFNTMVALHGQEVVSVPLIDAIGRIKTVPPDGELVSSARSVGISFGALQDVRAGVGVS